MLDSTLSPPNQKESHTNERKKLGYINFVLLRVHPHWVQFSSECNSHSQSWVKPYQDPISTRSLESVKTTKSNYLNFFPSRHSLFDIKQYDDVIQQTLGRQTPLMISQETLIAHLPPKTLS